MCIQYINFWSSAEVEYFFTFSVRSQAKKRGLRKHLKRVTNRKRLITRLKVLQVKSKNSDAEMAKLRLHLTRVQLEMIQNFMMFNV
jgi:hypothetical protein